MNAEERTMARAQDGREPLDSRGVGNAVGERESLHAVIIVSPTHGLGWPSAGELFRGRAVQN